MFTNHPQRSCYGRRYATARRQLLAFITAAFIILQPLLFVEPTGLAQKRVSQGGSTKTPLPTADLSVVTLGTPITQSFDTLPASGSATWTNDSTLPGWYHARTGTGTTIVANDGSSNAGNLYSYGTGTATDRALGSLGSGNAAVGNLFWGIRLTNNTGSTITSLDVTYTGEQWRNSAAAAQTVTFSYLVGSPTVTGSLAEFQSAGVAVSQLDFTSPITGGAAGALNGNLAANRVTLTHSITGLSIPNGTDVMLRWSDPDHTGADHGMSIDDFSVTPQGVPSDIPPTVSSTTPADNATGVALNANIDVTFSENVTATGSSFTINCVSSGAHTFTLGPGPLTYTLNPDSDFLNNEVCTVTVVAAQVADQDAPPDNMAADYVFDFTTVSATPTLSINDVSLNEGNAATTAFIFTVTLSSTVHAGVTYDICTADNTAQDDNPATEDNDYTPLCLTGQTIANGSNSAQHTINVNGDTVPESTESFFVNITNVTGATVTDGQGQGTIVNDDNTPIHDIQGNGTASPRVGQTLTTTGIVTLLRTSSNSGGGTANGFFLQAPDANADADPNTSEGIFVFTSSVPTYTSTVTAVAVGDELTVTGTVVEFNGLTEIGTVTNLSLIDTGNTLPTAVTLTTTILDPTALPTQPQLEKYESMRMTGSLTSVAPNDTFFDVETVLTGVTRPMREPGIGVSLTVPPDPTSGLPDCCIPRWDENPERLKLDTNGRAGAPNNPYTSNVNFSNVSGPLDFAFSEYRLIPDAPPTASANMTAVPVPIPLATEFTVAGFNIENFNNNATQRQKAALNIRDVMRLPYIIGVAEIFDLADLQALATEVNTISPGTTYVAHLIEADGTSEDSDQDVGFLVDTSRVTINSVVQRNATETYTNPNTNSQELLNDRPPLVLDANVAPTGANLRVIVIVNHLRSFIDIELVAGDGPRVRAKRKAQAESLAALLQEYQTNNPTASVISVGDYNAFEFSDGYTDPLKTIKGDATNDDEVVVDASPDLVNPNFTNLMEGIAADQRYSFMFEGTPQALDHVVINTVAQARNTGFAIARSNSDFPEVPAATYASNVAIPERSSDHDAPVAYFTLITSPTISTQASPGGGIGTSVNDVATLSGGNNATGTVTFKLFSDSECSTEVFSSINPLTGGTTATSGNYIPLALGTYYWTAVYSGDANNNGATSPCGAANESVTITQASPTISTQASAGGPIGTQVNDVATVSGGFSPTGTVTFRLFSDSECSSEVFTSTNPLTGGTATSDNHTPASTGTYYWTAVYNGDDNNNTATSPCGAANESVTILSLPDLAITKTHSGNFSAGQVGATYTITVSNVGTGPTDGSSVTVTDTVPVGLTPTGPVGIHNGWFCSILSQTLTCTRSDVLAGNSSYPSITLTVNVANPAPLSVTNTATVSGGGDSNTANNSASDVTNINCSADPSQTNNNPLVISRFRMNGPRGARDEFVEVFNPGNETYTVASGNCTGGLGVFASAGNGTTANVASMVCQIPNGTQIPARGYYLCTGVTYSLNTLGLNGGPSSVANAVGDAPIGCGGSCVDDIPNDAGLALLDVGSNNVIMCSKGSLGCPTGFSFASPSTVGNGKVYDSVGFSPYGSGAPNPAYPSLAGNFCEGDCLKPVGDASTGAACSEGMPFPATPAPPACYGQAGQYEFLRRQTTFDANLGTLHQDSNNNVNDILLVAPNAAINMGLQVTGVSGVTAVLGASVPQNSNAPVDIPRTDFTQAPFDVGTQLGPRNAERIYSLDPTIVNTANDPLGTFVLRLRYTNNSGKPVTPIRFRVDDLSTLCGPQSATAAVGTGNARNLASSPDCGAGPFTAILKVVNSTQENVVDSVWVQQFVYGTVLEDLSGGSIPTLRGPMKKELGLEAPPPGPLSPLGGGIDNTMTLNPSSNNATVGDGVTGGTGQYNSIAHASGSGSVVRLRLKFGVVRSGRFILLLTPQAKFGPTPFVD